jgi:hypothetical protein
MKQTLIILFVAINGYTNVRTGSKNQGQSSIYR